jgi:deoxyribodipyrimidine photolyase-related protein
MLKKYGFLLFPTQLYEQLDHIQPNQDIILVEDPIFYYDQEFKPFKVNKIKIAYLHACILAFLKQNKNVQYVTWSDIQKRQYTFLKPYDTIYMYDPIDHDLEAKYQKYCKMYNIELNIIDSPDMLINKETLKKEYFDVKKTVRHASFYAFMKTKLQILDGVGNLDKLNRSPPPKQAPYAYNYSPPQSIKSIYQQSIHFANDNFASHYGQPSNVQHFPITHSESKKAFDAFLKQRFDSFGKYEDAIMKDDPFMYHSVISPMLNVGLLTPKYILSKTLEYYNANKNSIPIASLEGFLRQIIGWRCFMQSLYMFKGKELLQANLPQNKYCFKDASHWYNGQTGILPFDEEVKKALQYGYAHHIVRLMVFMNFFILCEVHPYQIYKWFMEVVSMDAYSWVMVSNIYIMGYFYPRIMTKPYLSSSNYISKMSTYKKDGNWDKTWDALYHDFVNKKPHAYTFFYKRTVSNNKQQNNRIANLFKQQFLIKKNFD